jgi:hypothetical protein
MEAGIGSLHFDWKGPHPGYGAINHMSEELIQALNRKGVYYLHQAIEDPRAGMVATNWLSGETLEPSGALTC